VRCLDCGTLNPLVMVSVYDKHLARHVSVCQRCGDARDCERRTGVRLIAPDY
jgi:transcription elongation factor Elf1